MLTKCSGSRLVILRELMVGPKTWAELRLSFYGPERAKNHASTSFQNQLNKLVAYGVIQKLNDKWMLTDFGILTTKQMDENKLTAAKSIAQSLHDISKEMEG